MAAAGTRTRSRVPALLAGVGSGLAVVFLLLPARGVDTDPPACSSALGYSVPCGSGWAFGAALAVGLLAAGAVAWVLGRRP
ncbi:hypothetical protein [Longivirga aurantiaca]|uniref:Uncharacterized protein n=1 Tax=Longivirga aurantiaca TaxID=1837743 RepID=A0ABW1T324_9ACTN